MKNEIQVDHWRIRRTGKTIEIQSGWIPDAEFRPSIVIHLEDGNGITINSGWWMKWKERNERRLRWANFVDDIVVSDIGMRNALIHHVWFWENPVPALTTDGFCEYLQNVIDGKIKVRHIGPTRRKRLAFALGHWERNRQYTVSKLPRSMGL